jgi:hypothetical protein
LHYFGSLVVLGPLPAHVKIKLCFASLVYATNRDVQPLQHLQGSSGVTKQSPEKDSFTRMFQKGFITAIQGEPNPSTMLQAVSTSDDKNVAVDANTIATAADSDSEKEEGGDMVSEAKSVMAKVSVDPYITNEIDDLVENETVALKDIIDYIRFLLVLSQPGLDDSDIKGCLDVISTNAWNIFYQAEILKKRNDEVSSRAATQDNKNTSEVSESHLQQVLENAVLEDTPSSSHVIKEPSVPPPPLPHYVDFASMLSHETIDNPQYVYSSNNNDDDANSPRVGPMTRATSDDARFSSFEANYTDGHEVQSIAG